MNDYNKNIYDLCRLNILEEKADESIEPSRDITLKIINHRKREIATKIINNAPCIPFKYEPIK